MPTSVPMDSVNIVPNYLCLKYKLQTHNGMVLYLSKDWYTLRQ